MRVIRADAMGMCFGVRDALARAEAVRHPGAVTIHGELVHNEAVLEELAAKGFRFVAENRRSLPSTSTVMVTAHGISDAERARLRGAGKRLIDTTCPLVGRVHAAARRLQDAGYFVVVVGRRGHVEVRGIVEDLVSYRVVECPEQVEVYAARRLGIVCQTTAAARDVDAVLSAITRRNPHAEIRFVDTVCQPTKDRQAALERLLLQVEAVVVVGGKNSNNTRRLCVRCRGRGKPVRHVQGPDDLDPEWLRDFEIVGLTAGTSTPDATIDAVERALRAACLV